MTTRRRDPFAQGLKSFVTYRLARVQNRLNAQASATLRIHSDLSLTEWRIISLINAAGSTSAAEISREVKMDKAQISRAVNALVGRGKITSEHDALDHRQSILRLTISGKSDFDRVVQVMKRRQAKLTEGMTDEELSHFLDILDRLEARAEEPVA